MSRNVFLLYHVPESIQAVLFSIPECSGCTANAHAPARLCEVLATPRADGRCGDATDGGGWCLDFSGSVIVWSQQRDAGSALATVVGVGCVSGIFPSIVPLPLFFSLYH